MRGFLVAALAGLSACAQLFGIDETTGAQAPGTATLTLTRRSVGASVTSSPLDVTSEMATFYVPDPTDMTVLDAIPGTQTATNMWEADVAMGDPLVQYTEPDLPMKYGHLLALPSRAVTNHFIAYEHPDAQPPPAAGMEQVTLMLPTPYDGAQGFYVYVVGAWMAHLLAGAELPDMMVNPSLISTTIPFANFQPVTQSPAVRIAADDAVLVLRYSGGQLTGVYQQPGFDQSDTMDAIGGAAATMQEVALDKMMNVPITPATYNARFQTVRPGVTPATLSQSWQITAAPGYSVGALGGPLLQNGTAMMADTMVTGTFGNPFESLSWHALFEFVVSESRTFPVGAATATLYTQLLTVEEAPATAALDLPAPLPEQITIDAHQLNSDGSNVPLDVTASHTVSMLVEATPAAQLYFVDVLELVVSGTSVQENLVFDARSTDSSIVLPPGTFKTGSTYTLRCGTITGWKPNAADGDLDTSTLPFTYSLLDSGLFTVVAP